MKGKHFAVKVKTKKSTKSIVLSIVAMLELLLLITSITFSWFEGVTSLELGGNTFKTASVLNSHIEVGENSSNSDNTYTNVINLTSFFDTQKEVRLSPVSSSDAVNFYASYSGKPGAEGTKYRKLTKEDVNANIIQFQFNISSADGLTDVFLTQALPKVTIDGETYDYRDTQTYPFRFAFSDGATTIILKNSNTLNSGDGTAPANQSSISSLSADDKGYLKTGKVDRTQEYAYYTDNRETVKAPTADGNGIDTPVKPIFQIEKGKTKTITMTVWLEAFDYNYTEDLIKPGSKISFDIKLCTTWSTTCDITVYDRSSDQFIDNYDITDEGVKKTTALYIRNADGTANPREYALTYHSENHSWTGTIPTSLKYCDFVWKPTDGSATYATWPAAYRGNNTEVTILGHNKVSRSAYKWGLTPDDLTAIEFRDYYGWITNDSAIISIGIVYEGEYLEYEMNSFEIGDNGEKTTTRFTDTYGKTTWNAWIPSSVKSVNFIRYVPEKDENNNTIYIAYNYWYANNRGDNTVYRATDEGTQGTFNPYVVYVNLGTSVTSLFAEGRPYLSITDANNQAVWDSVKANSTFDKFNISDYKPQNDTWINGDGALTRISDTLWYTVFDARPANDTTFTIWTRSTAKYNEADKNMSFGEATIAKTQGSTTTGNTKSNTLNVSGSTKMEAGVNPQNNYALTATSALGKSNINLSYSGSLKSGLWGELTPPAQGTYDTYFIHTSNVKSVTVSFTYNNVVFTADMTKDSTDTDGKTWTTNKIPDDFTGNVTFTDNNGDSWTASASGKSSTNCYYYVVSVNGTSSTGKGFIGKIYTTSDAHTFYFQHYTSATSVTVSYTYQGVTFKFTMTKESNNLWSTNKVADGYSGNLVYSDGSRSWTVTKNTSKPYCYAISKYKAEIGEIGLIRVYLTNNWSQTGIKIYYWGGATESVWNDRPSMIKVARKNNQDIYCYLVPSGSSIKITTNEKGSNLNDITSNVTDMRNFQFEYKDYKDQVVANGTISASDLNSYSTQ